MKKRIDFFYKTTKMKSIILFVFLFICINSNGQNQTDMRQEEWTEISDTANPTSTTKLAFYKDGFYTFNMHSTFHIVCTMVQGTYIYQPETNEIFATVNVLNEKKGIDSEYKSKDINKQYFKIASETDSTLTVYALLDGEFNWYKDDKGKYNIIDAYKQPLVIINYRKTEINTRP